MSKSITISQVVESRHYGGPDRQMLGLAQTPIDRVDSCFASFSDSGLTS